MTVDMSQSSGADGTECHQEEVLVGKIRKVRMTSAYCSSIDFLGLLIITAPP